MDYVKRHKTAALLFGLLLAVLMGAPGIAQEDAEVQLQKAYHLQVVEGQLQEAIQIYKRVLAKPGVSRTVAAKALVQMGQCYEKLGDTEARKAYERVLREYGDQNEAATQARTRLAALAGGTKSTEMSTRRVWSGPDVDPEGAPSPDGKYLPYVDWGTGDLAVFDLVTGEKRRLTHKGSWADDDEFAEYSVPSPDSKQVAFAWFKDFIYELRIVASDGSHLRTLYRNDSVLYIEPKAWSADGTQILATFDMKDGSMQVVMVGVKDGSIRLLKSLKLKDWELSPMCLSTDGRYIAYNLPQKDDETHHDIFLLAVDGSKELPIVTHPADDYFLAWAPDGKSMLFASDRTGAVSAWAIDVAEGKPQGSPRLVKADTGRIGPLGFTKAGAFYYFLNNTIKDLYTGAIDLTSGRQLAPPQVVSERFTGRNRAPAWSPDGKYLAFFSVRHHPQGSPWGGGPDTIVVRSLESGEEREIQPKLAQLGAMRGLQWSPDGRFFVLGGTDKDGRLGAFRVDAQTGMTSLLFEMTPVGWFNFPRLTPDGKSLIYLAGPKVPQILARDPESGQVREVTSHLYLAGLALSPDGRQIAFVTQGKLPTLNVVPVAGGEPRGLYSLPDPNGNPWAWDSVAWSRDGSHIVFGTGENTPKSPKSQFWQIPAEGGEPQKLDLNMDAVRQLRIHPDGQHMAFEAGQFSAEIGVLENLLPVPKAAK